MLGEFKDELNGSIMTEFIWRKPTTYAFKVQGEGGDHKNGKCIPKQPLKNDITFDNYKKT